MIRANAALRHFPRLLAVLLAAFLLSVRPALPEDAVRVFAAASMIDVLEPLADLFVEQGHPRPVIVTGASSVMARQIEAGAPADVFISANLDWASAVIKLSGWGKWRPFVSNRLVVIGPAGAAPLEDINQLPDRLAGGRLAIAEPDSVPAGIYAREALTKLGLWEAIEPLTAPAENVRAALNFVVTGAAPYGVVYESDARDPRVSIIAEIPKWSYFAVDYYTVIREDNPQADAFVRLLRSDEADEIFAAYGFSPGHGMPL
ncbi:molybdate ABC transporter substrate-binding protein [Cucumibacter marinus]|uniref:molybdate ABC transporter substrate-binding protein n=1 Tax=Cucumibacter marinus TaxID=1121252 RepID=UPI0003FC8512|nr:molybdate ABC transporter substrate-binding protein [Cucumibacter marinus]